MKRTKLVAPYSGDEKHETIKVSKPKPGVYYIYRDKEIKYIGYSGSDVLMTMYRHFRQWNDTQTRNVYKRSGSLVKVIFCASKSEAAKLEQALILKLRPKDNERKIISYSIPDLDAVFDKAVLSNEYDIDNLPF